MDLLGAFEGFIQRNALLQKGDKIVVSVSGGMDSVVLLDLFLRIRSRWNLTLAVAHLNHGLRGLQADQDESFVRDWVRLKGLPFHSLKVDVKAYTKIHKCSIEQGARQVRFGFLKSVLNQLDFDRLALGHQANDQAETILMNLSRGAGLRGLRGICPKQGQVIRPLLFASRKAIEVYVKERKLRWVEDASNRSRYFLRNRVRMDVIRSMEKAVGGHAISGICRSGMAVQEVETFLDYAAKEARKQIILEKSPNEIILDIFKFLGYFKAVQKIVLIQLVEEIFQRQVRSFEMERILHLAEKGKSGGIVEFDGEGQVVRSRNTLAIIKGRASFPPTIVHVGQTVEFSPARMQFRSDVLASGQRTIDFALDSNIEYLDYHAIRFPLMLRTFQAGDRFIPLGMKGKKKLHDFFVDEGVPNYRRSSVPLLVDRDHILWVAGFRINERYKVTERTEKILKVEIIPLKYNLEH